MLFYSCLALNLVFAVLTLCQNISISNNSEHLDQKLVIPLYWETPLYHTEVDHFGYHPYYLFASSIYSEHVTDILNTCANQSLECERNPQGKINSVNLNNSIVNELTSIQILIESHSQHFINALLDRQNISHNDEQQLFLTNTQLKLDYLGSSLVPISNDDSYITAILILNLPGGFVNGNTLFILDPRPQPATQIIPHSSYVRYYSMDLEVGQLILVPSYVKWYMLPNADEVDVRAYLLFELSLIGLSLSYDEFNPFRSAYSARFDKFQFVSIEYLWGTPIWKTFSSKLSSLNGNLTIHSLKLEKSLPTVVKSNFGGWQSPVNQLSFKETNSLIKILKKEITKSILQFAIIHFNFDPIYTSKKQVYIQHSWFGVNRYSNANLPHVHPNNHISGVYYINIGQGGAIETSLFHIDPRSCNGRSNFPDNCHRIVESKVSAGNLILFPSWLEHFVEPCLLEEEPRIVFSFNAILL